jgi:hypothetical protein
MSLPPPPDEAKLASTRRKLGFLALAVIGLEVLFVVILYLTAGPKVLMFVPLLALGGFAMGIAAFALLRNPKPR